MPECHGIGQPRQACRPDADGCGYASATAAHHLQASSAQHRHQAAASLISSSRCGSDRALEQGQQCVGQHKQTAKARDSWRGSTSKVASLRARPATSCATLHRPPWVDLEIPKYRTVDVAHGFVSSVLAKQTGFGDDDLELVFQALAQMVEHDRSAVRGEMSTRGLHVFKHDNELGNAPAHALFDRLKVEPKAGGEVARSFDAYSVLFDGRSLAVGQEIQPVAGVTLTRKC